MNRRPQARIIRFALLAALVATILVIGSAALIAFAGVWITARSWRF